MEIEQAVVIAKEIADGVERWGAKNYQCGPRSQHEVVEALSALWTAYEQGSGEQKEEIAKLRKELSLSKAREGRARKAAERAKEGSKSE